MEGCGAGKLYRVSQGNEVDVASAQYFVNSSLAPVLLFRRRIKSVADVLKGVLQHGFSQGRWGCAARVWECCLLSGSLRPLRSLEPWAHWIPHALHGFYKWVFDALGLLHDFVGQVVVARRDSVWFALLGQLVAGGFGI